MSNILVERLLRDVENLELGGRTQYPPLILSRDETCVFEILEYQGPLLRTLPFFWEGQEHSRPVVRYRFTVKAWSQVANELFTLELGKVAFGSLGEILLEEESLEEDSRLLFRMQKTGQGLSTRYHLSFLSGLLQNELPATLPRNPTPRQHSSRRDPSPSRRSRSSGGSLEDAFFSDQS